MHHSIRNTYIGLLGVCCLTALAAPWPPNYLRGLPPDYLARMRDSLTATASALNENINHETATNGNSILWVRAGIPMLTLGQRVQEFNRFFESEKFEWLYNPKWGFSLFSNDYLRLYALMNNRTGFMPGVLSVAAQENFERQMWTIAKANSLLAEAQRSVLDWEGSENHHLTNKAGDLLAAQFLRKIPAYAHQKYADGSTPSEQYEARCAYFSKWFDERARYGQFIEAASPSYQSYTLNALLNIRDFVEDPVLRKKAEMFLNLAYANMAEETLLTTRGGPKSRVKTGHEYNQGMCDRGYDLLFDAPGRDTPPTDTYRATSHYYPPPAVVELARDTTRRGTYSFMKRWPGPVIPRDETDPAWRTLDTQKTVLRYGFATPDYVLGSVALDTAWIDDLSMGFRWQGVVFASDPLARIGFEVRPAQDKDWHGFNPFFSVQDRNILVTQRWAPVPPNPPSSHPAYLCIYFSPTLDMVEEEAGWIFARDGDAFTGIKVVEGGYTWKPPWQHGEELTNDNKSFAILNTEASPVIMVVNQASDYRGLFPAFKQALQREPIAYKDGILRFATIDFHGLSQPGKIGGRGVNLAPSYGYDSPFIRSEWGSGLIYIRKGNHTLSLDFRDPRHPVKTVGGPITPAFPPGVGKANPIILGKRK